MDPLIIGDRWRTVRAALQSTGDRFAGMVESAPDPHAMATADWSVADTAAHVAVISGMYAVIVSEGHAALPVPALAERIPFTTVDTVAGFNEVGLRVHTERDPRVLARRLREDVARILGTTGDLDPAAPVDWLGGSRVPLAGVLAHLLNEFQIHGRDVARALRAPWAVPPGEAALFFDLFLVGVTRYGYGRLLDGAPPPRPGRIAVEFRSRHTVPVTMALTDGRVSVEEPGGPTDVRLSFDPVTLNLMLFGRVGRVRAALTGKVTVRGRRPWLLPVFMRTMRLPS
ncbi:maleylpyruvate isomerase N-terminal domain-containing protein [Thermomonospora cellulosilytica]|uniref:Uncharacterized protein (TIGR03083 family) n=1 Tax=Thermomonospora cellulosilytica TaxID=1411118 RepID=A0A7W3N181_9ACTN|nr:maleylpyruvate isomerase N-terminal domain-containing protein [Thermomonospora cellulosilytica]MBA9005599.1 uncharacterized protein (TIGR03083 family) [Thermomonospora cellulosilytica]